MSIYLYAMHDSKPNGMMPVQKEKAHKLNMEGYGIFFAIQKMKSEERKIQNLDSIRCIAIDIDNKDQSKLDIMEKVTKSPLIPTMVVESKNGYHVYWILKKESWVKALNPEETAINYRNFLKERFVPLFGADKQACDVSRVLRMPGFYHIKNPMDPFLVNTLIQTNKTFLMSDIKTAFPVIEPVKVAKKFIREQISRFPDDLSIENVAKEVSIIELALKIGINISPKEDNFKCNCPSPSHKNGDKKPSLYLYTEKNSFYCFGCGVGGDVISFYQTYCENLNAHKTILKLKEMFR